MSEQESYNASVLVFQKNIYLVQCLLIMPVSYRSIHTFFHILSHYKYEQQGIFGGFYLIDLHSRDALAQLVALLPCSKKVLGSIPSQGSCCLEFACSPCACVGFHWVLPQSKNTAVR
ncbi:hypothetical protein GOODEAATRI_001147 [Goodea atripinnis]|uniref:Uncharacterized protein n=1 Tax=Goodea atripinnis TaxID=208336 RepID=A0ABV0P0H9_9TELE